MTSTINRRSLVQGATWAAPVVLSTAAIPAYAASTTACADYGLSAITETNYSWDQVTGAETITGQVFISFSGVSTQNPITNLSIGLPDGAGSFADAGDGQWAYSDGGRTATYIGQPIVDPYDELTGYGWFAAFDLEGVTADYANYNPNSAPPTVTYNVTCTDVTELLQSRDTTIRE